MFRYLKVKGEGSGLSSSLHIVMLSGINTLHLQITVPFHSDIISTLWGAYSQAYNCHITFQTHIFPSLIEPIYSPGWREVHVTTSPTLGYSTCPLRIQTPDLLVTGMTPLPSWTTVSDGSI